MKYMFLLFFLFSGASIAAKGQTGNTPVNVVITSEKTNTVVGTNENGELLVNVSPKDLRKFKASGLVSYGDFGARGDGYNL